MKIVLVAPEIPQNTGNIARTCAAVGAELHLIEPLGFSVDEKHVRRAGLDYWPLVKLFIHPDWEHFMAEHGGEKMYFLSTKGARCYADADMTGDCTLVFGRETRGLPEELLAANYERTLRIPMLPGLRSLNLGNSVALVAYESLRQNGFEKMQTQGALTGAEIKGNGQR